MTTELTLVSFRLMMLTVATRRAFHAMHGAALCVNGSNHGTVTHILNTAVYLLLLYGSECVYHTKTPMHNAEVTQAKLLKAALDLKSYCHCCRLSRFRICASQSKYKNYPYVSPCLINFTCK